MKAPLNLFFDLDGTLVDSSQGILTSFEYVCQRLLLPCPPHHELKAQIGPPISQLLDSFFPDLDSQQKREFSNLFRANYDNIGFNDFIPYPHVVSELKKLSQRRSLIRSISVVTNKPTVPARKILRSLCNDIRLAAIVGRDYPTIESSAAPFSTKTEALKYAVNKTCSSLDTSIYVGDTLGDMIAANETGLAFIAALYGFHEWSISDTIDLNTINSFDKLVDAIAACEHSLFE